MKTPGMMRLLAVALCAQGLLYVLRAVDLALWDLAGQEIASKVAGQVVYEAVVGGVCLVLSAALLFGAHEAPAAAARARSRSLTSASGSTTATERPSSGLSGALASRASRALRAPTGAVVLMEPIMPVQRLCDRAGGA